MNFHVDLYFFFFFFSSRRRHTRYWRDWSSDVCSSDLELGTHLGIEGVELLGAGKRDDADLAVARIAHEFGQLRSSFCGSAGTMSARSEEGRVGKEGGSRGSPYN